KFLVDCGMFQGAKFSEDQNFEDFPFDPKEIDCVLLTHTHIDHCGRLPKLVKDGYKGKVYATHATVDFAKILLADSAHVIESEAKRNKKPVLYEPGDVEKLSKYFEGVNYNQDLELECGLRVRFRDAGHILGSAIIEVWADGKKIVFSGDLGNPPVPIVNPTEFIDEAEYVLCESTYGGRIHEDSRTRRLMLSSAIYEVVTMKGVLMIPAFAMERSQEILYELNTLIENQDIPPIKVYLDSPLAINAVEVFKKHEALFNIEATSLIDSGDDIFKFPGLEMTKTTDQSKAILQAPEPKIIIAGSGMCHGGRIMHHLKNYLGDFRAQMLVIGYMVEGSLGRRLLNREKKVKIYGQEINVQAKVRAIGGYSAHADQPKLITWMKAFTKKKPAKVFITHGEIDQSRELAKMFIQDLGLDTHVPSQDEVIEL
ncbi:MBL fold metallo-hydrolase, partial [Patescibacteria group bacterium]|nr:MBL fold metallo-hydrolase [Patescibacteria group bacterium]